MAMRTLDEYLAAIQRHLWMVPAGRRTDDLTELRQHLEALIAHFVADGATPQAALQEALKGFGGSNAISRRLALSWLRGSLKPYPQDVAGFALTVGGVFAIACLITNLCLRVVNPHLLRMWPIIVWAEYIGISLIAGYIGRRRAIPAVPIACLCLGLPDQLWGQSLPLPPGVAWPPLWHELLIAVFAALAGMLAAAIGAFGRRFVEDRHRITKLGLNR